MATCYLHVGMHKTGSTSIQQSLAAHWQDENNILYAQLTPDGLPQASNHTNKFLSVFSERKSLKKMSERNKLAMDAFFEKSKGKDVLISGEGIIRLSHTQLISLQHYLSRYFEEIVIIAYIRPPCGYIQSAFQQVAKHTAKSFNPEDSYPNYRITFEKFLDVFGSENVKFWLFNPEKFPGKCVVRDFTKRLHDEIPSNKVVKVNEGLTKEAIVLIQVYWHHVAPVIENKEQAKTIGLQIVRLLKEVQGSKFSISSDVLNEIKNQHIEDISWMEQVLEKKLDEQLSAVTDNDISCDADLTNVTIRSIEDFLLVLAKKINKKPPEINQQPPINQAITILEFVFDHLSSRQKLRNSRLLRKSDKNIKIKDIVDKISTENPKLKNNASLATIRSAFEVILSEINKEEAKRLNINGLGRFEVKRSGIEGSNSKRIFFTPSTELLKSKRSEE